MNTDKTARIRRLNDQLRQTGRGGKLLMTQGISALGAEQTFAIVQEVREFSTFTEDNDPHGEHDFGSITCNGHKVFWKIDYYAHDMMHGSEDPSDPEQTVRVLTIMLASEY